MDEALDQDGDAEGMTACEAVREEGSCCCHDSGPKAERTEELKRNLLRRISRIEGQVRGIGRMVAEDVYCDDVLAQISAARSALDAAALLVLEHHLHHCVAARMRSGDETIVDELKETLGRLIRS